MIAGEERIGSGRPQRRCPRCGVALGEGGPPGPCLGCQPGPAPDGPLGWLPVTLPGLLAVSFFAAWIVFRHH